MSKKKKNRFHRIVSLALLLLMAVFAGFAGKVTIPSDSKPFSITVAVRDLSQLGEDFVPQMSFDDLNQKFNKAEKDQKKPPFASSGSASLFDLQDSKFKPLYEEQAETQDIPVVTPVPMERFAGTPRLAILIDDVGLVPSDIDALIKLPAAVTLSLLPYAPRLQEQANRLKAAGHDLMLHLPMEPMGKENPGPGALLTSQTLEQNQALLLRALDSFSGYSGVNNHMGSKFTSDRVQMEPVLKTIGDRGLFFVDSRTSGNTIASIVARSLQVPQVARDVFLDDDPSEGAIEVQIARAEQIAKRKGYAILIGHPHETTLRQLDKWLVDIKERGFELVPVRHLVR